jgi:hypothetical protein
MATAKTECSELSVGFGLLGYDNPTEVSFNEAHPKFDGTLSEDKYKTFITTYPSDNMFASMNNVGIRLRSSYIPYNNLSLVRWTGGDRQAATTSTAKDLLGANVPISVKAESRVVGNPSPYNLFVATPQGSAPAQGMASWYLETARDAYQEFYSFARVSVGLDRGRNAIPEDVLEFEASRRKRPLILAVKNLGENYQQEFQDLYLAMCRKVSQSSADLFENYLATSLKSRMRGAVLERVAKMFFRMNAVEYVLCGIDGKNEFAVLIPDLTTWLRTWQFEDIRAIPSLEKEQSIVEFEIQCFNKITKGTYLAKFHVEIRWSHGKFSSVEGKLYKEFNWINLPFFSVFF